MRYDTDIRVVPAQRLAIARFHIDAAELATIGEHMGAAFEQVMAGGASVAGPAVAYYEPSDGGFDVSAGFPVTDREQSGAVTVLDLPAVEVAHTTHVGAYDALPEAYDALRAGAEAQGRRLADGPMWEEYLTGPETPPERTRTEVYWPVETG